MHSDFVHSDSDSDLLVVNNILVDVLLQFVLCICKYINDDKSGFTCTLFVKT